MKRHILIAVLLLLGVSTQAQMIGATNNQRTAVIRDTPTTTHPLGLLARVEAGIPSSISLGYQFNPYVMVGAGLSGIFFSESEIAPIPLFVEARFSTENYSFAYFFDARICINLKDEGDGTPLGFNAQVGIMYKRLSLGIGISFIDDGYIEQRWDNYSIYSSFYYDGTDLILPSVSISYDIPFSSRH